MKFNYCHHDFDTKNLTAIETGMWMVKFKHNGDAFLFPINCIERAAFDEIKRLEIIQKAKKKK